MLTSKSPTNPKECGAQQKRRFGCPAEVTLNIENSKKWRQFSQAKKKRLIYIAGEAHSGSTATDYLLGRFLGRSCGQLVDLGLLLSRDGSLNPRTVRDSKVVLWQQFLLQIPHETRMVFRWIFDEISAEQKILSYLLCSGKRKKLAERFDESIASVYEYFGCDTLVDSSKNITRALGLQKSEVCDVYVVHLIRSPTDFLTSIAKRSPSGLTLGGQIFWLMHWSIKNSLAGLLRFYFGERYFLLNYKSVFLSPHTELGPLLRELNVQLRSIDFTRVMDEQRFEPELVRGNRMRFEEPIELRYKPVDDAELAVIHPMIRFLCRPLERLGLGTGRGF